MGNNEFNDLLKHCQKAFFTFLIVLLAGIGFYGLEKLCERLQLPDYLVFGTHWISIALFALDGIVVVGGALSWAVPSVAIPLIKACKKIRKSWKNEDE